MAGGFFMAFIISRRFAIAGIAGVIARPVWATPVTLTPEVWEGPFYPPHIPDDHDWDLVRSGSSPAAAQGLVMLIEGQLFATSGSSVRPLPNAQVEIWHADINGRYIHPGDVDGDRTRDPYFQGYGIVRADSEGRYRFRTIKPPAYPIPGTGGRRMRTPHIHVGVLVDGRKKYVTQMFFAGEPLNDSDVELGRYPDPGQRARLIVELQDGVVASEKRTRFDMFLPA